MGKQFECIDKRQKDFIEEQHIFFVATAASEGRVNVSPKGMDSLKVLGPNRILWLNITGSGNETAGHLLQSNRMTLMWCSFTLKPMILRAYGQAKTVHPRDAEWKGLIGEFPRSTGARQLYDMSVELVQSSCGFGVPFHDYAGPRDTLIKWAEERGEDGIADYWEKRNRQTIDGAPTGILSDT